MAEPTWEKRVVTTGAWQSTLRRGLQSGDEALAPDCIAAGLDSWILQDGNYSNFARGDHTAFALEFSLVQPMVTFEPHGSDLPALLHLGNGVYSAIARAAHIDDDWWVIDAGFMAFQKEVPPKGVIAGAWLRGELRLGIDPYFYFEQLSEREGAPPLIYDWLVTKIEMETAPFVEVAPRLMQRDPDLLTWREIERTSAWTDDQGGAEYLLYCKRAGGGPRRTLKP